MKTVLLLSSVLLLAILHKGKVVQGQSISSSVDGSGSGSMIDENVTPSLTLAITASVSSATSPPPTAESTELELLPSSTIVMIDSTPVFSTHVRILPTPSSSFRDITMSITTMAVPIGTTTLIVLNNVTSSMTTYTTLSFVSAFSTTSPVASSSLLLDSTLNTQVITSDLSSIMFNSAVGSTTFNFSPTTTLSTRTSILTTSMTQVTTANVPTPSSTMSPSDTSVPPSNTLEVTTTLSSALSITPTPIFTTTVKASSTFSPKSSPMSQSPSSSVSAAPPPPSVTVSRSPSPSVVAPPPSSTVIMPRSPSPSVVSPSPPADLPVPIIAGAAGGLCVVIVCVVCVVCLVCCCLKKRGKFEILTSGEDGTTLARDYQLQTFNDGNSIVIKQKKDEEAVTTDTFGIKSPPVEIDVGGQKFTFPDLPANGDSLPALIFINPVKPDEITSNTTYASRSSTLPSRKKNNLKVSADAVDIADTATFGGQVKASHSTSELNKDAHLALPAHLNVSSDQKASPIPSPIYDTPRTFKPLESTKENEKDKSAEASSTATDYVTMEPPPKKEAPLLTASQQPAPVEPTKSSVADRLAPKPSDAAIESIYDNARLIRPNPLVTETTVPLQTSSTGASSIYDVPRKVIVQADSSTTKDTNSEKTVTPETLPKKAVSTGATESVYDVPTTSEKKETTKTSDAPDTQPLYANVTRSGEDKPPSSEEKPPLFPKQSQTASKPTEIEATDSAKPLIPSKSALAIATKDDIIQAAKKLKSSSGEESSQTGSSKKPLILPKTNSVKNIDVTSPDTSKNATQTDGNNTKPVLLPKPNAAKTPVSESKTSVSESKTQAEGTSPKPLILPKPNSSTTDTVPPPTSVKPKIFPKKTDREKSASPQCESSDESHKKTETSSSKKASTDAPPQKSPKPKVFPRTSDQEKSASPQCESSDESRKETETLSSKTTTTIESSNAPPQKSPKPRVFPRKTDQEKSASPQCESSDESRKETETSSDNGTPEPAGSGEDGSSFGAPKPRAKPRKATRRQVGLPQNLMQELFARQSSQSKLAEPSSSPTKPPTKPKPNLK